MHLEMLSVSNSPLMMAIVMLFCSFYINERNLSFGRVKRMKSINTASFGYALITKAILDTIYSSKGFQLKSKNCSNYSSIMQALHIMKAESTLRCVSEYCMFNSCTN